MSVSLHPHEEARRKAWVTFVATSLPVAEEWEKRVNGNTATQWGVRERAIFCADELMKEYDKRFKSPYELMRLHDDN